MSIIGSLVGKAVGVLGPQKYLWAALGVLGITVVGEGWALKHEIERSGAQTIALKDAQNALDALRARQTQDAKAVVATKRAKRSAALKSAARSHQIDLAVAKNPQWRDQPIPQEVIDAILAHQGTVAPATAPTAGSADHPLVYDFGVHYSPDSVRTEGQGT